MRFQDIVNNSRGWLAYAGAHVNYQVRYNLYHRPMVSAVVVLVAGIGAGVVGRSVVGMAQLHQLQAQQVQQQAELEKVRHDSQQEVNALAARLGELQAQANRLNALGARLTRMGKLDDGEFNFDEPVGVGGGDDTDAAEDMAPTDLKKNLGQLEATYRQSDHQLTVLETLLFNRKLDKDATPSSAPVNTYITSGFGGRADPFGHGGENHAGIDFKANYGDPVRVVADGVVVWAGPRGGYGNLVEVDHGNGLITRYGHNESLEVKVGDLVHIGQEVAKAGSTGHSTGPHVHFEVRLNGAAVNPLKFLGSHPNAVSNEMMQRG